MSPLVFYVTQERPFRSTPSALSYPHVVGRQDPLGVLLLDIYTISVVALDELTPILEGGCRSRGLPRAVGGVVVATVSEPDFCAKIGFR